MHNTFKTILATSAIVMTAGIANAQAVSSETADMLLQVETLPATCTLTAGTVGTAEFDNLDWSFATVLPTTATADFLGITQIVVDAPDDVVAPDASTLASAVSNIDYNGNALLASGSVPFSVYTGALGDGNAMNIVLAAADDTDNGVIQIQPTKISMDPAVFTPTQENVDYTITYTVSCYE